MIVHLTNEILYDIADLADNIEENFGSQYADVFEQEITDTLNRLSSHQNIYPGTGVFYRGSEIRKVVMRPSLIFYVVLEDGIHALRALRQERNWEKVLRTETDYTYRS